MTIDRNELYREVTSRICGSLDFLDALKKTNKYLQKFIPHDRLTMLILRDNFKVLEIVATTAANLESSSSVFIALTKESRSILEKGIFGLRGQTDSIRVINEGTDKPIHKDVINTVSSDAVFSRLFADTIGGVKDEHSMMILKLDISDTTIGYLSMTADGYHVFNNTHARLLKGLAEPFAISLSNYLRYREIVRLKDILDDNQKNLQKDLIRISGDQVIGSDGGLLDVMEQVKMVASIDSPVLILGDTGVGKEVVANAIHRLSDRHEGPMISVNCGAIPETLADSELFGHEKGAFTGASALKRGYFERADGGTIFLDEIGELSPATQVKLLRFIQTRTFDRVGGTQPVSVDIRIIAATHRDLENMIEEGTFRQDLWFRLNVFPIEIPPLKERKQDIPDLVDYLISRKCKEMNLGKRPAIAEGAIESLKQYDWPGNVRELQNIVERALIISRNNPVVFDIPGIKAEKVDVEVPQLPLDPEPIGREKVLPLDQTIKNAIELALTITHGRIEGPFGAAKLLMLPPSTLKNKMKKLGIARREFTGTK